MCRVQGFRSVSSSCRPGLPKVIKKIMLMGLDDGLALERFLRDLLSRRHLRPPRYFVSNIYFFLLELIYFFIFMIFG